MECSKDDENVLSLILDMNGKKPVENLIENCISILDSYILDYIKVCQAEIQKSLNNSSNYLRSNSIAKLIEHKRKTLIDDLLNKKDLLKEALNDRIELNHELDSNLFNDLVEKRIKLFEENFLSIIEMSKKISSNNSLSQLSDNEIDERKSLEKFTDFLSDTEVCMSLKYFKLHKSKLIKKYNKSTNKKQKTNKKLIEFVQSNMDSPLKGKSSLRKHSSDSKLEQMVFLTNLNINLNEMCGKKSNRLNESDISCNGYISSDEQSEDCYIIDDSDSNETEATSSESKPVRKYLKIKIKCGMRVLALRDPVKHVWDTAQIVKIKALENNLNYNENKLKSSSASKYLIKFDESHETRTNSGSIPEYENYKANNLNEANEETSNDSSFNEINSSLESTPVEESDDEIEVIVTENGREPIKKRRPIGYKQPFKKRSTEKPSDELVELDSSSLAFLQTPNSNELPDLPYIDYDPGTKTFILPIRSRVVTLYRVFINDSNDKNLLYSEHLCSGSIGELPCLRNSNRYLVIFDNGFVSYAKPNDVFPIFDLFESPFARLDLDHSCFVQNYFQHYPNRLMVHLDLNDIVGTYLNSKWHQLKVIEVDASLVRLELDTDMFDLDSGKVQNHSVWYYRGTFNFLPLYETLQNKINESDQLDEYEKYIKERKIASNLKLISSFSSTSFPQLAPASSKNKLKERIQQGQSKLLELSSIIRNDIVKFVPHACTNACVVKWETSLERVKYVNPLLMPAMHGWQRRICQQTQTLNTASKKWVKYMAPCGRMLRSTGEVDHYLLLTNSKLTIDMFSFDCFILTDREFEANAKYVKINDITQGKESVPISCVNCIDSSQPEQFEYSNKRIALEDVPLDINTQLMEGCKCEDNCRDRSKCSCWHKTFEATTFDVKNGMNTNVGYRGRRLQEFVSTGIFECNPLCKCDHRCSNRVVQNGISLRLQLYKSPSNLFWS